MAFDMLRLVTKSLPYIIPLLFQILGTKLRAIQHRRAYKAVDDPKNVVVIGGSFAGVEVAQRLATSLPTGYRIILIEKNSHFNYSFNFPRYSVLRGHEKAAFVPYNNIVSENAPSGIFEQIQDKAISITDRSVQLASGKSVEYDVLVVATGTFQPLPAKVVSTDRDGGCAELQSVQNKILEAKSIAIAGAGAVGVELAADIADFYPDKKVTLIHSRDQLLNRFGRRLHDHVLPALEGLGIRVLLKERPKIPGGVMGGNTTLTFSDGHEETFDLVIPCTGDKPNSSILASILPKAVSPTTSRILVNSFLQVTEAGEKKAASRIFALGDVAEHGGPMMARAGYFQGAIVAKNVVALIQNREDFIIYRPQVFIEGAIKLTLGKSKSVIYNVDNDGNDVLVPGRGGNIDLNIRMAWRQFGADPKEIEIIEKED